jgi:hypothetical protein
MEDFAEEAYWKKMRKKEMDFLEWESKLILKLWNC